MRFPYYKSKDPQMLSGLKSLKIYQNDSTRHLDALGLVERLLLWKKNISCRLSNPDKPQQLAFLRHFSHFKQFSSGRLVYM